MTIFFALFIYLFGVLRRFQHYTGHTMTGSWKGRGNQYIQFIRFLYCKLPTNSKQLPAFSLEAGSFMAILFVFVALKSLQKVRKIFFHVKNLSF